MGEKEYLAIDMGSPRQYKVRRVLNWRYEYSDPETDDWRPIWRVPIKQRVVLCSDPDVKTEFAWNARDPKKSLSLSTGMNRPPPSPPRRAVATFEPTQAD